VIANLISPIPPNRLTGGGGDGGSIVVEHDANDDDDRSVDPASSSSSVSGGSSSSRSTSRKHKKAKKVVTCRRNIAIPDFLKEFSQDDRDEMEQFVITTVEELGHCDSPAVVDKFKKDFLDPDESIKSAGAKLKALRDYALGAPPSSVEDFSNAREFEIFMKETKERRDDRERRRQQERDFTQAGR
jgi:hypothetical protein